MGIIKTLFIITVPISGSLTYLSLRLGKELPIACRQFGRNIGMGYNYFKVILQILRPPDNNYSAQIIQQYRQTNLQTNTLQREMSANFRKAKKEARDIIPEKFSKDPFDVLKVKTEKSIDENQVVYQKQKQKIENSETDNFTMNGSDLLLAISQETKRLQEKKKMKKQQQKFYQV